MSSFLFIVSAVTNNMMRLMSIVLSIVSVVMNNMMHLMSSFLFMASAVSNNMMRLTPSCLFIASAVTNNMMRLMLSFLFIASAVDMSSASTSVSVTSTILPTGNTPHTNNTLSTGPAYNSMTNLYTELLKNYDTRVRPRKNLSEPVKITGSFLLSGVLDFDTASQKLTILGYFIMVWSDEMLVWDSVLHDGIVEMKFPISQVWTPVMIASTSFAGNGKIGNDDNVLSVSSRGYVLWVPEDTYKIICDVNIQFYPFDKQYCDFHLYISDTVVSEVNLAELSANMNTHFKESSEWRCISVRSERNVYFNTAMIRIVLELERRREFIQYTMIAPLLLLSVLNVGVFIVPVDSGEKGSIAVTIFLAYGVFISTISDELPHNSLKISYILIYILLLLLLSVTAVVYAYVQSFIYARYANERVTLGCLRRLDFRKISPNTKPNTAIIATELEKDQNDQTFESKLNNNERSVERDVFTWVALLRKMDVVVFAFFFLVVVIATSAFFGYMSHESAQ